MSTALPRRQVPPTPPPQQIHNNAELTQDTDVPKTLSLAARIASLQLSSAAQTPFRNPGKESNRHERPLSASLSLVAPTKTFALVLAGLDPGYLSRLLARPPPPIPHERSTDLDIVQGLPPQLPPRRRVPPRPPLGSPSHEDRSHTRDTHGDGPSGPASSHNYHMEEEADNSGLYHTPEVEPGDIVTTTTIDEATGAPTEEEAAASGMYPAGTCIKCYDFSAVDAHAAQYPRQDVRSLDELAYNLTEPFTYETEKARALFTWMHHNIHYDAQSFLAGTVKPATPESTLSSGLAVCDGYAGLFVNLAEKAGLQAFKVSGHGKGFGYRDLAPGEPVPVISTNHAWNCVLMDGEWHLLDATWGAGFLNGSSYEQRFNPSWFTSTPVEFARSHFPSDPTYQLIAEEYGGSIGWDDYILSPPGPIVFGDFYQLDFLVDLLQPASNVIGNGQTVTFTLFKRCEHMTNHDVDNYVHVLLIPGQKPVPLEPNAEGGWSLSYRVVDQTEVSLMYIATVEGQDAKGIGIRGFYNALDRKAMSFGGLAKWTVV